MSQGAVTFLYTGDANSVQKSQPQMAENSYLPLTCDITLTTVTHYTVILHERDTLCSGQCYHKSSIFYNIRAPYSTS